MGSIRIKLDSDIPLATWSLQGMNKPITECKK